MYEKLPPVRIQNKHNQLLSVLLALTAALLSIALLGAIAEGFGYRLPFYFLRKQQVQTGIDVLPVLFIATAGLFLFLFLFSRWVDAAGRRGLLTALVLICAVLLAGQFAVVFGLNIFQQNDAFEVQDQALAIARGLQKTVDYTDSAYFRKYGNNDLYLALCIGFFRLLNALHIRNIQKAFVVLNMVSIDAGIAMACGIVRMLKGSRNALKVCLLCALNPLNYVLLAWTYTCTLSVPLMMAGLFGVVLIRRNRKHLLPALAASVLIGLSIAFGYAMRPTAVFPMIAVILVGLIVYLPFFRSRMKRSLIVRSKKALFMAACVVLVTAGSFQGIKAVSLKYDPVRDTKFPIEHWLMVGLAGNGRVNNAEMKLTASGATYQEKQAICRRVIAQIIKQDGLAGLTAHSMQKIVLSWSDGTAEYFQRTTFSDNSNQSVYAVVSGSGSTGLLIYCQAYRIVTLFLAAAGVMAIRRHRLYGFPSVFAVTLLGGLLFYILWEGKPVYSYPFTFFLILTGGYSFMHENAACRERAGRQVRMFSRSMAAVLAASLLVSLSPAVIYADTDGTQTMETITEAIVADDHSVVRWNELTEKGASMEQNFYPASSFNRIRLVVKKTAKGGKYRIVLSADKKELNIYEVKASAVHGDTLTLGMKTIHPAKNQRFTISIINENGKNSISWGARRSYTMSQYKGIRKMNGVGQPGDTLMRVYEVAPAAGPS
jgi:hypothetical protein